MSIDKISANVAANISSKLPALKADAKVAMQSAQAAKKIAAQSQDVFVRRPKSMEDALVNILGYKIMPLEEMKMPKTLSNVEQITNYLSKMN